MAIDLKDREPGNKNDEDWHDLDKRYSGPSASSKDLPDGHPDKKKLGASELGSAEKKGANFNFGSPASTANPSGETASISDTVGKGFQSAATPAVGRFLTRRKAIGGGAAGVGVTIALVLFSVGSGPTQFIHIGQLLERFHFSTEQDAGDSRTLKIYKYAKGVSNGGTLENTRLGIVGKRIAVNADKRFATIGVEKNFSKGFAAQYEGVTIKQEVFAENATDGGDLKNLSKEEFKVKFQEKFGFSLVDAPDGSLVATRENIGGFLKNRKFNILLADQSGYGKTTGSVVTRIMGQRDGVTWHPIKKADAKVVGSVSDWVTKQVQRIKGGEKASISAQGQQSNDANGNPDPESNTTNAAAADATNGVAAEAEAATADAAATSTKVSENFVSKITGSTAGAGAIAGVGVVGLACAAQGLSHAADDLKHDLVVLPLIRTAMEGMSLGGQAMNGPGANLAQMGYYAKQLTDPDTGESWVSSRSMQAEQGQELTGKDLPAAASVKKAQDGTLFSNIIDAIPGLNVACAVSNSVFGQAVNFAVALTTPISSGITFALSQTDTAKDLISSLVRWMAGSPIPAVVYGADYGNYLNYGARLASNDAFAAIGGTALSATQSLALHNYQAENQRQDLTNQSFAERMVDPYSPDSLLSKAIDGHPTNTSTYATALFGSITNPTKIFSSLFSPFTHRVAAASATTYDYGFPEVGFSLDDLDSQTYDNPYDNADAVVKLLTSVQGQSYITRAKNCFGINLSDDGTITSDFSSLDVTKKDFYTNTDPDHNCSDKSVDWTRVRFYILDTKIAEAADCYNSADAESCTNVGFGSGNGSAPAGNGDIGSVASLAVLFSWPEKWPPADRASEPGRTGPLSPKQEYAAALLQYNKNAPYNGADCGAFVATVMHASGADPSYPLSSSVAQEDYVRAHPEKYDVLDDVPMSDLKPGDILIVNKGRSAEALGHTYIFVGGSDPKKNQASASGGDRMPNLGGAEVVDSLGRGNYLRARLK